MQTGCTLINPLHCACSHVQASIVTLHAGDDKEAAAKGSLNCLVCCSAYLPVAGFVHSGSQHFRSQHTQRKCCCAVP